MIESNQSDIMCQSGSQQSDENMQTRESNMGLKEKYSKIIMKKKRLSVFVELFSFLSASKACGRWKS